jgi:hypothetical protein
VFGFHKNREEVSKRASIPTLNAPNALLLGKRNLQKSLESLDFHFLALKWLLSACADFQETLE